MKNTLRNLSAGLALAAATITTPGCEKPRASETVIEARRVATAEEIKKSSVTAEEIPSKKDVSMTNQIKAEPTMLEVYKQKAKDAFGGNWNVDNKVAYIDGMLTIKVNASETTFGVHISDTDRKGIEEVGERHKCLVTVYLNEMGTLRIGDIKLDIGDKRTGRYAERISLNYFNGSIVDSRTIRDIEKAAVRALLMYVEKVKEQKE